MKMHKRRPLPAPPPADPSSPPPSYVSNQDKLEDMRFLAGTYEVLPPAPPPEVSLWANEVEAFASGLSLGD